MPGANEAPDDDARRDVKQGQPVKYRDRPANEGRHGDADEEPNEGYPDEGLPENKTIERGPGA